MAGGVQAKSLSEKNSTNHKNNSRHVRGFFIYIKTKIYMSNILDVLLSSDAFTPVNKLLAKQIGFLNAGYFGELIRQRKRFGKNEFFFSQKDMENENGISKYQQIKACTILKELGFITIEKKGVPCKNYFKIHDISVVKKLDYWQSKNSTTSSKETKPLAVEKTDHSCNKNNNKNNNNIISKEITKSKDFEVSEKPEYTKAEITKKIDFIIEKIKAECDLLGVAYDRKAERNFTRHIMRSVEYGNFCKKIGQTRLEFAINILRVSDKIAFWRGVCAGPKMIYQNYIEVYNTAKTLQEKQKRKKENSKILNIDGVNLF